VSALGHCVQLIQRMLRGRFNAMSRTVMYAADVQVVHQRPICVTTGPELEYSFPNAGLGGGDGAEALLRA